jgi:sulfate transport system permease protein
MATAIVQASTRRRHRSGVRVLPGFGLTMGYTILYLCLIVLIPLAMLFVKSSQLSPHQFRQVMLDDRVLASFRLSFGASLVAAVVSVVIGLLVAWVLVRYRFPGRRLLDGFVDLPFALPTAVAGISLTTVFEPNGWLGKYLEPHHIKVDFTPLGIVVALTFIGLPFVIRTVQPVLEDLDREVEEAASSLGANRLQIVARVLMPTVVPATMTGFALAFARGLGEYGSVVFISGNIPYKTEIIPLLIYSKLDE